MTSDPQTPADNDRIEALILHHAVRDFEDDRPTRAEVEFDERHYGGER